MIKRLVCSLIAVATLLLGSVAFAQVTPGNVAAVKQESNGVLLTMQHGT